MDERPAGARRIWRLALGTLAAAVALNVVVFATRLGSLLGAYRLFITEGGEGSQIYAVWRAIHRLPLYEWPNQGHFTLTPYNFLFYQVYGALLHFAGIDGEAILLWGRWVTVGFGVAGCVAFGALLRSLLPADARDRYATAWIVLVAPLVWFGTNFTAWWVLSIRPDIPALCFVVLALWLTLTAVRRDSLGLLALASALFWAAWTFKQSIVMTVTAACLYLLLRRRSLRHAIALGLPFASLAAITLLAASPQMLYNFYAVPRMTSYHPALLGAIVARVLVQNAFFWLFPLGALLARRRGEAGAGEGAPLVGFVVVVGVMGACATLGLEGANKNHLFEAYLAVALLASYHLLVARVHPEGYRFGVLLPWAAAALILPMAAFPAAQLVWTNRFGVTRLADAGAYRDRAAVARRVDALPKPLFVSDDILAQPWHSSAGKYPAYVIDPLWSELGRRRGLLAGPPARALFRSAAVRAALVPAEGELRTMAESSGYSCEPAGSPETPMPDLVVCLPEFPIRSP